MWEAEAQQEDAQEAARATEQQELHTRLAALEAVVLELRQQQVATPSPSGGSAPQKPGSVHVPLWRRSPPALA